MEQKVLDILIDRKSYDLSFETGMGRGFLTHCDCLDRIDQYAYDIVITSPPYNVGIPYDSHNDSMDIDEYFIWMRRVFSKIYNNMNSGGRLALNILQDAKMGNKRVFVAGEFWKLLTEIGFLFECTIELKELSPQRTKLTAWGSWLSQSAPYIYNPQECVMIMYKDRWKREKESLPISKEDFMECTGGSWKYQAQTKKLTEANFSLDFPLKALKILAMKGDVVLDPFMGSGTTAIACEELGLQWRGFEISEKYFNIARRRIRNYVNVKELL
jgi:site-specific DNA-methyltransferase (adenine-specific)